VDNLYTLLISKFNEEVSRLEIGYTFNQENLDFMNDLLNAIDYLSNASLSQNQILQIIKYYSK